MHLGTAPKGALSSRLERSSQSSSWARTATGPRMWTRPAHALGTTAALPDETGAHVPDVWLDLWGSSNLGMIYVSVRRLEPRIVVSPAANLRTPARFPDRRYRT
jgi:hypothetical protein